MIGQLLEFARLGFIASISVALFARVALADDYIRYTTDTTQTSLPIWWAQEHGLFEKFNLKYSDGPVSSGFIGLQAIGAGRNDASIQSDPPTCINITKGVDAKVVAVISKGDRSMGLVAHKKYKAIQDLVGKKVLWMTGTGGEVGFIKFLAARNLKLSDFQHINLPPSEALPTLINNEADAMWYWEPWPRKAMSIKDPNLVLLARSSRNEYDLNMVLAIRRDFADKQPQSVENFLRVLIGAAAQLNANPHAAAELYAQKLHTSIQDARDALGDYPVDINLSGDFLKEFESICALEAEHGDGDAKDWNDVVDPKFLRIVAPERLRNFPY